MCTCFGRGVCSCAFGAVGVVSRVAGAVVGDIDCVRFGCVSGLLVLAFMLLAFLLLIVVVWSVFVVVSVGGAGVVGAFWRWALFVVLAALFALEALLALVGGDGGGGVVCVCVGLVGVRAVCVCVYRLCARSCQCGCWRCARVARVFVSAYVIVGAV